MKALSIQQPWAWLIANGFKPVENRTWATTFRGPFLIHAGKKIDPAGYEFLAELFPMIADIIPGVDEIERGGIVGVAELWDCGTIEEIGASGRLAPFPNPWLSGPYGFLIRDPAPCKFVPITGKLGFFTPNKQLPIWLLPPIL